MKAKLFSVVAIPALVMASASAFAAVEGETSTIQFTGAIKENTCTLDQGSLNQKINLNTVETSVFQGGQGAASQPTNFTIALKDCAKSSASVFFSGDHVEGNAEALKVTGGAKGVGIQILEGATVLKVDGSAPSSPKEVDVDKAAEWSFGARYVALGSASAIEAGEANATAQFTVNYE
ncbi:fimbrial protein [Enterobacter hormaechei]|nr:type 1 fimbrial protein [Enterobacter hormaechei]